MNFQHVFQVLKMFPIAHGFFFISFFGWGEQCVLAFFGFFFIHNVFPMNSPCVSKTPKMFPIAIHFFNI